VLNSIEENRLVERAAELGDKLVNAFKQRLSDHPQVVDIRGMGLLIGIELEIACAELVGKALESGMLINVTANNVVRLLPPLVMTDEQADNLVDVLSVLIENFLGSHADTAANE
jgi:acetylornithine aminotransferase